VTHIEGRLVPPELRAEMLVAAVFWTLIDSLPSDPSTVETLVRRWSLDPVQVERWSIRQCPTVAQNLVASAECARVYGDRLKRVPGFYSYDRLPCVCADCDFCELGPLDTCACETKSWRVDLDPKLSHHGIIVPQRKRCAWMISGLSIFRHPGDQRPFPLRVRGEAVAA
jgi:hypothetical protein